VVTGQSEFDQSTFSYLYRLNPPDTEEATADVAIAKSKGFTRVALVFGNDIGSQSFVGPAEKALTTAGITLADSESLNLSAPSFRTEVAKVLASHPDAILTETVGPAAASFFSELKAQNGGKLLPMVSSSNGTNPDWYDAVSKAVGAAELSRVFSADTLHVDLSGAAYDGYVAALVASNASPAAKLDYYKSSPYTIRVYDAAVLCALAMTDAKSIDPAIYQSHIKAIAAGGAGAVDVETYAAGLAALAQGQKIHYIGASGAINFNQYNNNAGTYQIVGVSLTGATTIEGQISPTEIATLKGSGG